MENADTNVTNLHAEAGQGPVYRTPPHNTEVEAALLAHESVAECAVIGVPDEERGSIVQAHVVLGARQAPSDAMAKLLQDHVKASIAPYKYPRSIIFAETLPKTESGKIQRFRLRKDGS